MHHEVDDDDLEDLEQYAYDPNIKVDPSELEMAERELSFYDDSMVDTEAFPQATRL